MTKRFIVPTGDYDDVEAFAHDVVKQIRSERLLETKGVVLVCDDIEVILGDYSADVFYDRSVVDDVCLDMTPIIYELMGYLAPGVRYNAINDIRHGTKLCRVVHVDGQRRNPLFACDLTHMDYIGAWGNIDMSRPTSISPTFELMGIKPEQQITYGDMILSLDWLNLRAINAYECSRLSSLAELVLAQQPFNLLPLETRVERLKSMVSHYQSDPDTFIRAMLVGRSVFALAFWMLLTANDSDLLFGNLTAGTTDCFIESLVGNPQHAVVQILEVGRYHADSATSQIFQPYLAQHEVLPFVVDAQQRFKDDVLHNACKYLNLIPLLK